MKLFYLLFFFISTVSYSQTTSSQKSPDDLSGYTYDYDIVKDLLIDQKLRIYKKKSIFFKDLVNSVDFPAITSPSSQKTNDLIRLWIEAHPDEIILALKKAKRFDILKEF